MAPSQATIDTALAHPIDLVTRFVARHDWLVRQQARDAIIAEIPGRWSDYQLAVSWQDGEETMQVVCRIDVSAEQAQVGEIAMLAALLNQQLYIGHLALDVSTRELELRHTLALRGAGGAIVFGTVQILLLYGPELPEDPRLLGAHLGSLAAGCHAAARRGEGGAQEASVQPDPAPLVVRADCSCSASGRAFTYSCSATGRAWQYSCKTAHRARVYFGQGVV